MNAIRRIGVPHLGHGQPLLPVGRQAPVEVAALAVHVDVQGVEAGAALGERLGHDVAHRAEQAGHLRRGQPAARPTTVDPAAPQRLVGVDVPDAGCDALVEQDALDLGLLRPHPADERPVVEGRIEGIPRDVRHRCRHRATGVVRHEVGHRKAPEGPLVDEAQLGPVVGEGHAHPQVLLVGGPRGQHQQLPAHPQMPHGRGVGSLPPGRQREPQVLAATGHAGDGPPPQPRGEVPRAGRVPAHRPRVPDLHVVDRPAGNPSLESGPDHLDLGKLRHATR